MIESRTEQSVAQLASEERSAFAARLRSAIEGAKMLPRASELARHFGQVAPDLRVTQAACRKWLLGETIPTQERVVALAGWLDVSASWLRYGAASEPASIEDPEASRLGEWDSTLIEIAALTDDQRRMVSELSQLLLSVSAARRRQSIS